MSEDISIKPEDYELLMDVKSESDLRPAAVGKSAAPERSWLHKRSRSTASMWWIEYDRLFSIQQESKLRSGCWNVRWGSPGLPEAGRRMVIASRHHAARSSGRFTAITRIHPGSRSSRLSHQNESFKIQREQWLMLRPSKTFLTHRLKSPQLPLQPSRWMRSWRRSDEAQWAEKFSWVGSFPTKFTSSWL